MNLPLVIHPDDRLRQVAEPIAQPTDVAITQLASDMIETMIANKGVGLAAPQIGQNLRLIIVTDGEQPIVMINPEIIKRSFGQTWGEEGCLSIPHVFGEVRRAKRITVRYTDLAGKVQNLATSDFTARVVQHEIDHINGVLFIDKGRNIIDENET